MNRGRACQYGVQNQHSPFEPNASCEEQSESFFYVRCWCENAEETIAQAIAVVLLDN